MNSRKDHLAIRGSPRNTFSVFWRKFGGEGCGVVLETAANAGHICFANTDREWRLNIESYGLSDSQAI